MFSVEKHDNSYEYFSNIDLDENALHITANLSLEKLLVEINNDSKNKWKIKSIEHLLSDIYPNLYDSLKINRLKIELRNILINNNVDQNLMQEDNLNILFSDFKFLIESGIRTIPNIVTINKEQETIINVFNEFVQCKNVQSIIKELSSGSNLKQKYTNRKNSNIEKIYVYNFNNLHLSRMVFFNRLKYLGLEVVFRIPQFNIYSIDEPWKNLYTKELFKWEESSYKRYNSIDNNSYIDYIEGNEINDDSREIIFKEFLGSFEFKNELENDKDRNVSYYALDTTLINQVFDIDEDKEYNMPLVRFMINMYNCKNKDGDIYLNYNLLTELITSGWIEIKEGNRTINGIDYLDFMKNLESYFEGVDTIDSIITRIEELRYLKLASDTMENEVKQKIGKNGVKRFLSNPFRCISYINIEDYDITLIQFKTLVERLKSILKSTLKREDGFQDYNNNCEFLKIVIEKNEFIKNLQEDENYKDTIKKIYAVLNYSHEIELIYKEDVKELISILMNNGNKEKNNQILPIDTLDGDWQRNIYDQIHITDLSFKAYQKYLESRKIIGKYINHKLIEKILDTDLYKSHDELKKSLQIAKLSVNNIEQFFSFDIANIIVNYKGIVVLSFIKNLRDGDSESILLRILKNLYKKEIDNDSNLLNYLDDIEYEDKENKPYVITSDITNKSRMISPVGFRDLDFCYSRFIYSNILGSNVVYETDFHHRLVFSTLISLLKRDIPNYDENIRNFIFPIFPQWNETTKENMILTNSMKLSLKDYYLYENINYPKNIDRLQILRSKYLVTEKYKVKNRYENNKLDTAKLFDEFVTNYLNNKDLYHSGRHCTMCPHILICKKGEYVVERAN